LIVADLAVGDLRSWRHSGTKYFSIMYWWAVKEVLTHCCRHYS